MEDRLPYPYQNLETRALHHVTVRKNPDGTDTLTIYQRKDADEPSLLMIIHLSGHITSITHNSEYLFNDRITKEKTNA